MTKKERTLFWVAGIIIFVFFLYLINDILLPFVVGILVAYFLDPVVGKLEKSKLSRTTATLIITATFFVVIFVLAALLVPVLYDQLVELAKKIPQYTKELQEKYLPILTSMIDKVDHEAAQKIKDTTANISGYIVQFLGELLTDLGKSGVALLNLISLIFISPVVSFYMLRDWHKIIAKVNSLLPVDHASTIREQVKKVDETLAGYIRGQSNVCVILGIFYATGLLLIGVEFGFFIGFATGILAFIPFVGFLIGFITALFITFFQFGDISHILMVVGVFMAGQVLESNFLTPKLVGEKVGLHPVWVIFGLLVGGALFGFTGVLLAVPVSAVIGVLVRFSIEEYTKGPLYNGVGKKK